MLDDRVRTAALALRDALREPRDPPRRPPGRVLRGVVLVTAVLLTVTGAATAGEVVDLGRTGGAAAPLLGAAAGLPLLLALRHPLIGWALSAGSALVVTALPALPRLDGPWPWPVPHGLALLGLLLAVAVRETLARTVVAWAATALLLALTVRPDLGAGWVTAVTAVAVVGVLAGRLGHANRRLARESVLSEQEKARRLVLEERARIARDLHDVVAHHMSLVAVRTETAPYRIAGLSDAARAELVAIGDTARAALGETRTLLTVLRGTADDEPHDRAPQPDLVMLGALVEAARSAGVDVRADITGVFHGLRPGTSLAAYRILQEALANAVRHAPGAAVRLTVHREPDALRLEVTNGPSGPPVEPGPAGHGITGMRERARAEGGDLTVARTTAGGCTVRALLPAETRP